MVVNTTPDLTRRVARSVLIDNSRRQASVFRVYDTNVNLYTYIFLDLFGEMNDKQLIELVKQYSVLYDMKLAQYRDHTVRNNAWEEIGEQMNTSVEEVKNKWSKLRNCFTNALKRRRKKSRQAAAKAVPWKFEKQMEFLLPYVELRSTVTNLSTSNDDESTQYYEYQFSEESEVSPHPTIPSPTPATSLRPSVARASTQNSTASYTPRRLNKNDNDNNVLKEMVNVMKTTATSSLRPSVARASTQNSTASYTPTRLNKNDNDNNVIKEMVNVMKTTQEMRQKRAVSDMDENDLFFLSMSKQLKILPKTDQSAIKFQLHKLIHESEMKMLNNREQILNTPIIKI